LKPSTPQSVSTNLDELRLLRSRGLRLNPEQFKALKEASENERLQSVSIKIVPPIEETLQDAPGSRLTTETVQSSGTEEKPDEAETPAAPQSILNDPPPAESQSETQNILPQGRTRRHKPFTRKRKHKVTHSD
jgi:hypothetical protein